MWKAFAEHFKECGRNGTLFVFALVAVFPLVLLVSRLADELGPLAAPVFGGLWVLLLGGGLLGRIHQLRHPARLGKLPPLSQNELSTARSKLMKPRTTP